MEVGPCTDGIHRPLCLGLHSKNLVPRALNIGSEQDSFLLETSAATPSQDQNKTPRPSTFCLCILPQTWLWSPHHVWQDPEAQCLQNKQEGLVKSGRPQENLSQSAIALVFMQLSKKGFGFSDTSIK